jgi:hypothetical protein
LRYYFAEKYNFPEDETDTSTVHKARHILGPKGEKQVEAAISMERGKNIIATCSVSGFGNYTSPEIM